MKKSLRIIFRANYRHLKLKLVFVNGFEVDSFFKFEDLAPTSLVTNAKSFFKCGQCSTEYKSETFRQQNARVCNHFEQDGQTSFAPSASRIRVKFIDFSHQILQEISILHIAFKQLRIALTLLLSARVKLNFWTNFDS